jgi:transcriptional regulator with XRE-family HTH domain
MSIVDYAESTGASGDVTVPPCHHSYHRLAAVRRSQGISRRTIARRMNLDLTEVRRQEDQQSDLPLSVLFEWQKALDVPLAELLIESGGELSRPLRQRAQLVRLMKTALSLFEEADDGPPRRVAQSLVEQLIEVMPELQHVTAWNVVGKRRRASELGVTAFRRLSDDLFLEAIE